MEIIRATEKHIPEIIELWKEFMEFNRQIDPFDMMSEDGPTHMEKHLRSSIHSKDALVLVALDGSRAVGYSISAITQRPPFFKQFRLGFIQDMAVSSGFRRSGIGKEMLKQILEWFKSRKIDRIETSVVTNNEIASSFWEKSGFRDYERVLFFETYIK